MVQRVVVCVAVVHSDGAQGEAVASCALLDVDGRLEQAREGGGVARGGAVTGTRTRGRRLDRQGGAQVF
jgi:hypothetical protein